MTAKIYLQVVEPDERDSVLVWTGKPGHPMFLGNEPDESLACGSCKTVLAKHMTTRTFHERFAAENRLVIRCACGAHVHLPSSTA